MEELGALTDVENFWEKQLSNFEEKKEKQPLEYEIDSIVKGSSHPVLDNTEITGYYNHISGGQFSVNSSRLRSLPYNAKTSLSILQQVEYYKSIQEWKGYVSSIDYNRKTFEAVLEDLIKPGGTKETVEFEIDEIPADDHALIQKGAVFYWSIGKRIKRGTIKKESSIRFQRLVNWTSSEYDNAADEATSLMEGLIIK